MKPLKLTILTETFAVCRFNRDESIPEFGNEHEFLSLTKTGDEISLVIKEKDVLSAWKAEKGWTCIKVLGPLDFSLVGILASITSPLGAAGISLFAISTFDTDYILIKKDHLNEAKSVLSHQGFLFIP
ncbi:MAG: ACT domain-containing protein [Anaerolineaceae bacterium]|nr:ACT domain-containing protein [Anaerolineaceae bacterium]